MMVCGEEMVWPLVTVTSVAGRCGAYFGFPTDAGGGEFHKGVKTVRGITCPFLTCYFWAGHFWQ
jgi:hypothetical protein